MRNTCRWTDRQTHGQTTRKHNAFAAYCWQLRHKNAVNNMHLRAANIAELNQAELKKLYHHNFFCELHSTVIHNAEYVKQTIHSLRSPFPSQFHLYTL